MSKILSGLDEYTEQPKNDEYLHICNVTILFILGWKILTTGALRSASKTLIQFSPTAMCTTRPGKIL